jgi:hypothetical protein
LALGHRHTGGRVFLFFIIKAPVKGNLLIFCVVFGFSAKKQRICAFCMEDSHKTFP